MEKNKKIIIFLVGVLVVVGLVFGAVKYTKKNDANKDVNKSGQKKEPEPTPVPVNTDDMAFAFLKLENTDNKNIVYSPLSIRYAFQVLAEGATGESREQLDNMLKEYNTNKYKSIDGHLSFGNALFIRDTYYKEVKSDYLKMAKEKYDADIFEEKFENADNVNNWIDQKTLGLIKKLLDDKDVQDPDLEMIIANALAIDMEWKHSFDESDTYDVDFTKADGKKMAAKTMHGIFKDDNLSYYVDDDVNVISMKLKEYGDMQFDFYAIMPNSDINSYINNFDTNKFNELTSKMVTASTQKDGVRLAIPKFNYETNLKLVKDLQDLGIENIFIPSKANLSNIVDTDIHQLYVSEALHKAKIEFSEKGVKAAAVTAILMKDNAMFDPGKPLSIEFDKPFIYVIKDTKTNAIWFVGSVFEPEGK